MMVEKAVEMSWLYRIEIEAKSRTEVGGTGRSKPETIVLNRKEQKSRHEWGEYNPA